MFKSCLKNLGISLQVSAKMKSCGQLWLSSLQFMLHVVTKGLERHSLGFGQEGTLGLDQSVETLTCLFMLLHDT